MDSMATGSGWLESRVGETHIPFEQQRAGISPNCKECPKGQQDKQRVATALKAIKPYLVKFESGVRGIPREALSDPILTGALADYDEATSSQFGNTLVCYDSAIIYGDGGEQGIYCAKYDEEIFLNHNEEQ